MKHDLASSRRRFLKASLAAAALPFTSRTPLAGGATGIVPGAKSTGSRPRATVGFIYVGAKSDLGYNQAHAEGAAMLRGIEGVNVIEAENVPETAEVEAVMERMVNENGASLILPTSFGYMDPYMLALCAKYPQVQFRHCGGVWRKGVDPANAGSYFNHISMGQYLNGITAGHATKYKKLGFIAAKPIPQVLLNINSFLLGARAVDSNITCQVAFTGEWSNPVKEKEAATALTAQGVDVVSCHVDSPTVALNSAAGLGAFVCGYHANQSAMAPARYLTGVGSDWGKLYKSFLDAHLSGKEPLHFVRVGIAEGAVKMNPLGPAVNEAARRQFDATLAKLRKQGIAFIESEIKARKGQVVAATGRAITSPAIDLESTDYLVEGVISPAAG